MLAYHERIHRERSSLIPLDPAEDQLKLFRYRWYNYISIRHDDREKQVFDPAVSGISDGNEPMRNGLLAKLTLSMEPSAGPL